MQTEVASEQGDFKVTTLEHGARVLIESRLPPLSLQARRARLKSLKSRLADAVAEATDFHFTHDVEATFNWFVSDRERYQTHTAADLDNVLKPLLDATTGPNGVMIDDNQIQSVRAWWMQPSHPDVVFTLELASLHPDDTLKRAGAAFVEFTPDTSYLLPGEAKDHWALMVEGYRRLVEHQAYERSLGLADDVVAMSAPIARPWHTQRLRMQGFTVIHESSFPRSSDLS